MGTGHVGLVTSVMFATIGHEVVGTDIDVEKIELLRRGIPPFFEPGLEEGMARESASGRLSFTTDAAEALRGTDVVFICVGTPARASGDANLLAMEESAKVIAQHAPDDTVLVEKSTVPAGTADRVRTTLEREGGDAGSTWPPTRSSSAKVRRWKTRSSPIGSWSASSLLDRWRSCGASTHRSSRTASN